MCLKRRRNEWTIRLIEEYRASANGYFITLTYDPDNIPIHIDQETGDVTTPLVKEDLQGWIKRIRARRQYLNKKTYIKPDPSWLLPIRYFAVGEYGDQTQRPHYHILLFNYPKDHILKDTERSWKKGRIQVGNVTQSSIHYCAKYCLKGENFSIQSRGYTRRDPKTGEILEKTRGIGYQYAEKIGRYHADKREYTYKLGDYKHPLPKYYKKLVEGDPTDSDKKIRILDHIDANYFQELQRLERKGYKDPENEYLLRLRTENEKGFRKAKTLNKL